MNSWIKWFFLLNIFFICIPIATFYVILSQRLLMCFKEKTPILMRIKNQSQKQKLKKSTKFIKNEENLFSGLL